MKNTNELKGLIINELSRYTKDYGLKIYEVQIKSIKPSEQIIDVNESNYIELLKIKLETLSDTNKIEVLALFEKKYGIRFSDLAKYDLINKGKISISEILKTYNVNINSDLINELLKILKK